MTIEEIQESWKTDNSISSEHLTEASIQTPNLHSKYLNYLIPAKLKLAKITSEYKQLRRIKFRYYRGELTQQELKDLSWDQWQGIKPLKNEMDEFLLGDKELCDLELKMEYYKTMVYALESIMSAIKARDWQIKSIIDWSRFSTGN